MASWYDSEIQMLGKLAEIKETPANIQYFLHRHTWSGIRQMAKKHNADIQLCSNLKVVDDIYNYFINLPENKKALSSFVVDLNRANGLDSVEQIGRILIKEKDRKYFIEKISEKIDVFHNFVFSFKGGIDNKRCIRIALEFIVFSHFVGIFHYVTEVFLYFRGKCILYMVWQI